MTYKELRVQHKDVSGKVDFIVQDDDKSLVVVDFKGSSSFAINQPTFRRLSPNYALQLFSYTYMLQKTYGEIFAARGTPISKCSLLFINRDKPSRSQEFTWDVETALKLGGNVIKTSLKAWKTAKNRHETKNVKNLRKHGLCHDPDHYKREVEPFFFGGCHLADICVKSGDDKMLKEHFRLLLKNKNNG